MQARDLPPPLTRFVRRYVAILETLLISGVAAVVVIATLQVFFRYVVGASLSWSEEALRYIMIWITSLGLGLAYSRGEMIGMELLVHLLPPRAALVVTQAGRVLVLAMMLTIAWYGWKFAWKTRGGTATAIPVSMFLIHISVAVGSLLVALHVAATLVLTFCRGTEPRSTEFHIPEIAE